MSGDGTVSLREDQGPRRKRSTERCLVQVLNAASPMAPPACIALDDVDEIELGRGPVGRVAATGPRRLRVDLADAAVSSTHARLNRAPSCWIITDEGSKNGVQVNGLPVERAEVGEDGLVALGNCFFLLT